MPTSLTDVALMFGLPIEALAKMKKDGLLGKEIEDKEIAWFVLLGQMWGNPDYVRLQTTGWTEKQKKDLFKPKEFSKMDKYIMSRYRNTKPGDKIFMEQLVGDLELKFGIKNSITLRSKIKKLRKAIWDERRSSISFQSTS
jgi:hypothetical protein